MNPRSNFIEQVYYWRKPVLKKSIVEEVCARRYLISCSQKFDKVEGWSSTVWNIWRKMLERSVWRCCCLRASSWRFSKSRTSADSLVPRITTEEKVNQPRRTCDCLLNHSALAIYRVVIYRAKRFSYWLPGISRVRCTAHLAQQLSTSPLPISMA